jgi:hypothetical protein
VGRRLPILLAALLVPAVALASTWHIIGQGVASGKFTVAAASATAIRPAAIELKVSAKPNVRTVARYSIQCRKRSVRKKAAAKVSGRTPITKAVTLPMAHPAVCVVVASATLASQTKITVTILAR